MDNREKDKLSLSNIKKGSAPIFDLKLLVNEPLTTKELNKEELVCDLENDCAVAVISMICDIFEISGAVRFKVSGFGQNEWPVDCRTDLATVMEEVPEILKKIELNQYDFILDFYEQGMERQVTFSPDKDAIKLTCSSRTYWTPDPVFIHMKKEQISRIFEDLYSRFLEVGEILCIDLIHDPLLEEWKV
ncbi:hypothetical protein ACWGPW_11420 [Paenibacillus chitinolyticus]